MFFRLYRYVNAYEVRWGTSIECEKAGVRRARETTRNVRLLSRNEAARRIGAVSMLNSEARGTRCTRDVSKVETKVSLGSEETLLPFELAHRE